MNRIRELRKKEHLSGEALGKMVGVQKSAISKYELGQAQPSQDVLVQIANCLKTSTDYLLGNTDDPTPPDTKRKASAVLEAAEALRLYAESKVGGPLTQEELKRLDAVIDTIINGISNQGNT